MQLITAPKKYLKKSLSKQEEMRRNDEDCLFYRCCSEKIISRWKLRFDRDYWKRFKVLPMMLSQFLVMRTLMFRRFQVRSAVGKCTAGGHSGRQWRRFAKRLRRRRGCISGLDPQHAVRVAKTWKTKTDEIYFSVARECPRKLAIGSFSFRQTSSLGCLPTAQQTFN